MKKAKFIHDIKEFSPNVKQQLFRIEPANFENMGVKFIGVKYIVVSAANRSARLREVSEKIKNDPILLFTNTDPDAPENKILETKVFETDRFGKLKSMMHIFGLKDSASIEDCLKAFGYEIERETTPFDEV